MYMMRVKLVINCCLPERVIAADMDRHPRPMEVMQKEATWLHEELEKFLKEYKPKEEADPEDEIVRDD